MEIAQLEAVEATGAVRAHAQRRAAFVAYVAELPPRTMLGARNVAWETARAMLPSLGTRTRAAAARRVEAVDGTLMLRSETLGLDLLAGRNSDLHFRDPATGQRLPAGWPKRVPSRRSRPAAQPRPGSQRLRRSSATRVAEGARELMEGPGSVPDTPGAAEGGAARRTSGGLRRQCGVPPWFGPDSRSRG